MTDLALARLTRRLDALAEDVGPVAQFLATFHTTLVQKGFTREEALQLVMVMEKAMLEELLARVRPAGPDSPPS